MTGKMPVRPTARMAVLRFPDYPCHFACDGIHSRCGKLPIASEHTLDQLGIFRCADEKQNVPRMIDERKCERQAPRIQFGNKICNGATRHLFQRGSAGKERRRMAVVAEAEKNQIVLINWLTAPSGDGI